MFWKIFNQKWMYGKKEGILKGDWPDTFQEYFFKGNLSLDGEACHL